MFISTWKESYRNEMNDQSSLLEQNIRVRLEQEIKLGFDSRDEMREVFLEISEEFNVAPDLVWKIYYG